MDLNLLRTAVFEKTGIKVDTEDPIFALVALHETVLAESVAHQLNAIDEATARLQRQTTDLLAAAEYVKALLQASGHAVDAVYPSPQQDDVPASAAPAVAAQPGLFGLPSRWMLAGCALAGLTALLTLIGLWLMRLPHG